MSMPGFTAEDSLDQKKEDYQREEHAVHDVRSDAIVPQACREVMICFESDELQQSVCRGGFWICD
jgi:hypothetical protein